MRKSHWSRDCLAAVLTLLLLSGAYAFDLKQLEVIAEVPASPSFTDQLGNGIALMSNGTRVVAGDTRLVVDFDPGVDELIIDSPGDSPFVALYPEFGAPNVHVFENPTNFAASADFVALDSNNNIYVTGTFNRELRIGDGLPDLAGEAADAFVAKLDPAGSVQWAFVIGGDLTIQEITGITVRGNRLVIVGYTQGNDIDFDPDDSTLFLASGSGNGTDSFIASYSLDGEFEWVNIITQLSVTGSGQTDEANGVVLADNGEVFVGGAFNGTADFDGSPAELVLTSNAADAFLARYSQTGAPIWVKQLEASSADSSVAVVRRMAETEAGGIIATGQFIGSIDFDPDPVSTFVLTSNPPTSAERFVAEFDAAGALIWARRIESGGSLSLGAIQAVEGNRRLLVGGVGNFGGGFVDFDPENDGGEHSVVSTTDAFVVLYDDAGNYEQSAVLNGTGGINKWLRFRDVVVNGFDIQVVGDFNTTFDADPGPATSLVQAASSGLDILIGAYGFDQFFSASFEN